MSEQTPIEKLHDAVDWSRYEHVHIPTLPGTAEGEIVIAYNGIYEWANNCWTQVVTRKHQ